MSGKSLNGHLEAELELLGVDLAEIIDNANDAIIVTDIHHKIIGWNRRAQELHGFKTEDVGKNVIDTIIPRCARKGAAGIVEALGRGDSYSGECTHVTKDGREIPVRVSVRAILDKSGRKVGFLGINADISEIRAKEERLQRQNRELRAFRKVASALSSPLPIKEVLQRAVEVITRAVSADAGAVFLLDGKGATFSPLVHDGIPESVLDELRSFSLEGSFSGRIIESGKGLSIRDVRGLKGKSLVLPATMKAGFRSLIGAPIVTKKGILGTLEVACRSPNRFGRRELRFLTMLTSQVAGAVENAVLREELRKSLRWKTRLVRDARHRLTNNLQAIASMLSVAVESEQWTGDGKAAVDSAIRRISGMAAIQQQMDLDEYEAIELADVMERIEVCVREIHGDRHEMRFSTKGSGLRLSPLLASSLAIAINELVWNSCVHGFDFEQKGSIAVEAEVADGIAKITVKDNGKGIPGDFDLERDANTGLSIVRNLVERDLNGRLILRGKEGTTATITWTASPVPAT